MADLDRITVKVPLRVVVYAVKFAMGQPSFNEDAADLARVHWNDFPDEVKDQILRDARLVPHRQARPWWWLLDAGAAPAALEVGRVNNEDNEGHGQR